VWGIWFGMLLLCSLYSRTAPAPNARTHMLVLTAGNEGAEPQIAERRILHPASGIWSLKCEMPLTYVCFYLRHRQVSNSGGEEGAHALVRVVFLSRHCLTVAAVLTRFLNLNCSRIWLRRPTQGCCTRVTRTLNRFHQRYPTGPPKGR